MRNISPLEFMNKEYFGTDIFLNNGNVLVQSGTRVTPEILMKLYFTKVYVSEKWNQDDLLNDLQYRPPVYEPETINTIMSDTEPYVEKIPTESDEMFSYGISTSPKSDYQKESTENIIKDSIEIEAEKLSLSEKYEEEKIELSIEDNEVDFEETTEQEEVFEQKENFIGESCLDKSMEETAEELVLEQKPEEENEEIAEVEKQKVAKTQESELQKIQKPDLTIEETEKILPLEFNKDDADKLAQLAVEVGKLLNFSVGKLKELEKAGYYLRIGMPRLTTSDIEDRKTFRQKLANASYQIVMNEMHLPEPICTSIRNYVVDYNIKQFNIAGNKNIQIPNIHILAVVNCYVTLRKTRSKEDTLKEMLYIGGNKFNVFLLHKFIHMMRMRNDQ